MNIRGSERGSTHIIVIAVLIIAIVGLLGFVFWKNFIDKPETKQQTTTKSQTKSTNVSQSGKLAIKEWGLSGSYDESTLGTLTYTITRGALTFSSPKVNALLPCDGIDDSSWKFLRITPEEMTTMGAPLTPWTKIGDNYYERVYPQTGCDAKASELSAIDKAYSDLFASLKAN